MRSQPKEEPATAGAARAAVNNTAQASCWSGCGSAPSKVESAANSQSTPASKNASGGGGGGCSGIDGSAGDNGEKVEWKSWKSSTTSNRASNSSAPKEENEEEAEDDRKAKGGGGTVAEGTGKGEDVAETSASAETAALHCDNASDEGRTSVEPAQQESILTINDGFTIMNSVLLHRSHAMIEQRDVSTGSPKSSPLSTPGPIRGSHGSLPSSTKCKQSVASTSSETAETSETVGAAKKQKSRLSKVTTTQKLCL